MEQNQNRDHIEIGKQLNFYTKHSDVGQGLVLWKPYGAMVRYLLEKFSQEAHILNGYQWVYSPHIGKATLWETSGHLSFFKDAMYNPIEIDNEQYYLKPMNCPFHVLIYKDNIHSYRDLPLRLVEYGSVYRYELSGTLHGLTRVRGFTQDDAHIIASPEQMQEEVQKALDFSLYVLRKFNLQHFKAYIATRNAEKSIGDPKSWDKAESALKQAVINAGLEYEIDLGGGAFYGPKIDLKLIDNQGREWQCSTIQFDFNLPERFEMSYIGKDGQKHTPMMVHRALFGSIERFAAMLLEHFNGEFPIWLAPVQVRILPVSIEQLSYAETIMRVLKKRGFRVELDASEDTLGARIRNAQFSKVPMMLILGEREHKDGTVTVRFRGEKKQLYVTQAAFMTLMEKEQEQGRASCIDNED